MLLVFVAPLFLYASPAFSADRVEEPRHNDRHPFQISIKIKEPVHNEAGTGFADLILKEAFRRIGREVNLFYLPAARGIRNVKTGIDDGFFPGIIELEEKHPDLIRISESVGGAKIVLVHHNAAGPFEITEWHDLKPYRIGRILGWNSIMTIVPEGTEVIAVENFAQLVSMLRKGRLDIAFVGHWMFRLFTEKHAIDDIAYLEHPVKHVKGYLYVNKKHAELNAPLSQALKELKKEGFLSRAIQQSLK
ncbi:MAG: transporter substrate-binding domain-containing protein [Magnetococcales bacterium]|nr:transporter substrate-binding domain-containing protein [Magnetococcales bacterium]